MQRKPEWDAYEEAVMAGQSDVEAPGDDYVMSDRFRDWLVDQMRAEVMGQVNAAGLDRMALVGSKDAPGGDNGGPADGKTTNGSADEPE